MTKDYLMNRGNVDPSKLCSKCKKSLARVKGLCTKCYWDEYENKQEKEKYECRFS